MLKGEVIAKDLMSNKLFKFECQNIIVATDPEGAKQLFDSSNSFSIPPKRRYAEINYCFLFHLFVNAFILFYLVLSFSFSLSLSLSLFLSLPLSLWYVVLYVYITVFKAPPHVPTPS